MRGTKSLLRCARGRLTPGAIRSPQGTESDRKRGATAGFWWGRAGPGRRSQGHATVGPTGRAPVWARLWVRTNHSLPDTPGEPTMKRRTLDIVFATGGLLAAGLILVLGLVL